jgi:hypothetical protein
MKQLCSKTVIEFKYENEEEAERHEKIMKSSGWNVEYKTNFFIKHFRCYSQRHKEGAFFNLDKNTEINVR